MSAHINLPTDLLDAPQLKFNTISQDSAPLIEWTGNPLDCLQCRRQVRQPMHLPTCRHVFCITCLPSAHDKPVVCPLCRVTSESVAPDALVAYLVASTTARADDCANCDKVSPPMFYCDTCKQTLCVECKNTTHEAKMFSSHRLAPARERVAASASPLCAHHEQPLVMFDSDDKRLLCLACFRSLGVEQRQHCLDLDVASDIAKEKLSRSAHKMRRCCEEMAERASLQRQQLSELEGAHRRQRDAINDTCQQLIDRINGTRDKLLEQQREQEERQKNALQAEQRGLIAHLPPVNLYLLATSILVSSAEHIDLLTYSYELKRRMHGLLHDGQSLMQAGSAAVDAGLVDYKRAFADALEPFVGLSSTLLPPLEEITSNSGRIRGLPVLATKYQLMVDLAGEFGNEFARIEQPYEQLQVEVASLVASTHEVQRDLTLRKCIVDDKRVTELLTRVTDLTRRVLEHNDYVTKRTPDLHQLWQEELDRVRRQQQLYRARVEQGGELRHQLLLLSAASRQLVPFIMALSSTARAIDPERGVHELDLAPMERICAQINSLTVDAASRVDAIEKEERQRQERDRTARTLAHPKRQLQQLKMQLKETPVDFRRTKPSTTVENERERRFTTDLSTAQSAHRRQRPPQVSPANRHSATITDKGDNLEESLARMDAESNRTPSRLSIIPPAPPPPPPTNELMKTSAKIDEPRHIAIVQPRTRDETSSSSVNREHLRPQSCTPGQLQAHDAMMRDIKERVARIDIKTPDREIPTKEQQ